MMKDTSGMPNRRMLRGFLLVVFFGFLFPLISPWHVLTLTQVLGFAFAVCLEVTLCIAAYEHFGVSIAVAIAALTNVSVVVGWAGIRMLVTMFLSKSSWPKDPQNGEDN